MPTELTAALIRARARTFDLDTVFTLDLSHCSLESLSPVLLQCPNLHMLDVSHNALTSLAPLTSSSSSFPNLHSLDVSHNRLTSLPPLSALPALLALTTDPNPFTSPLLPSALPPTLLTHSDRPMPPSSPTPLSLLLQQVASMPAALAAVPAAARRTSLVTDADVLHERVRGGTMDREKVRGMLEGWPEYTAACDDAVSTAAERCGLTG